jgi:hypothetical protein
MPADSGDAREVRAARNQAMFRAANEKLREMVTAFNDMTGTYVIACECADAACVETIEIDASEYSEVRSNPRRFAVLAGHVYPEVEIVVGEFDGHAIVEKIARAGEIAEATDPRRA